MSLKNKPLQTMRLLVKALIVILAIIAGVYLFQKPIKSIATPAKVEKSRQVTVAITQFVEHPALDAERKAILEVLHKAGFEEGKNLTLIYQNAQGNMATAAQIATQIVSKKPDLVVAISTPSAQTLLREVAKHNIPLVFSAVTDPVAAKLVDTLSQQRSMSLVTGVSDALSVQEQIAFVQKIVPHLKNLGTVYNPGEANSAGQIKEMQQITEKLGINLIIASASKTAEVATATESLVGKVDAILIPNDNTVVSSFESAVRVAEKNNIPLLTADIDLIDRGAVAAVGYNRKMLGRQTGEIVVKILRGVAPSEIPVVHQHSVEIRVNALEAQKIGLNIPKFREREQ